VKAANSTVQQLIEGTKVFAVPLYQRRYTWGRANWQALWDSVLEQYDFRRAEQATGTAPVTHFIGSFVLSPAPGAASSPTRYVLVDGQQRLTTMMVLLAAVRDLLVARAQSVELQQQVTTKFNTLYLHNAFEQADDKRLRLLPTQQDRADFASCVWNTPATPVGRIGEAYKFFTSTRALKGRDLRGEGLDLEVVTEVMLGRFALVEIDTEAGDNVHRIFQTLNSAGVKLTQVDLLRNHFFMLLPTRGEELYSTLWRQMELALGEGALDKYFWAELVRGDQRVSRQDVYAAMQRRLAGMTSEASVADELVRLERDSREYAKILEPDLEESVAVRPRLTALTAWGTDTVQPLVLELLVRHREGRTQGLADVSLALAYIESFLVRRMLCGIPTNNLNRIFSSVTSQLPADASAPQAVRIALSGGQKYWPTDSQVRRAVVERPFYWSGQPGQRRFVLEKLEAHYANKELIDFDSNLSIEHVMPQTLSHEWEAELLAAGVNAEEARDRWLHTLGNLTLSGYNPELGNASFDVKRRKYADSALALNRDIGRYGQWTPTEIQRRGESMGAAIVEIWPGPASEEDLAAAPSVPQELLDAVLLLPESRWTTTSDLAQFLGASRSYVEELVRALPLVDRVHVLDETGELPEDLPYEDREDAFRLMRREQLLYDADETMAPSANRIDAAGLASLAAEMPDS
jgi:Protein of unknown function DUF262/Protein of unknown function (DUF1524)